MKANSFSRSEKLKSRKAISSLFSEGLSEFKFPVKCIYLNSDSQEDKAAFVVPKKHFKAAVKRNLLKRRMKEAYRLLKGQRMGQNKHGLNMIFIFVAKENESYETIYNSIDVILLKLFSNE